MNISPLSEANLSFKVLISLFLMTVAVGYVFGLIHIYTNVGYSYTGIVTHYRGTEKELDVPPELAMAKLIHHQHVHVFGLSMLFLLMGIIFTLTQLPEWLKVVFVMAPFLGLLLDMSSFWLVVFSSPVFAWGAMVFGGFMALSFFLILGRPLYEMWILPLWYRKWGETNVPPFLR